MIPALRISSTGLDAQQTKMSVISNNLANVSTTGFKRDRAVFEDLIYQNLRQSGANSTQDSLLPSGLNIGTGVNVVSTHKLFNQGELSQTKNQFDLAISGQGFFQVSHPDGSTVYTRDGEFSINADGDVVTSNGYLLEPAINVPTDATSFSVGTDGVVSVVLANDTAITQIGQIDLANFINPAGLQPIGDNYFRETTSSGAPTVGNPTTDSLGSLRQGYLEASNVNVVEELVNMIETQRAYEVNSKSISTADQMLSYVNQQL
jgi:flagellar basal-body rod protein FlgG